MSLKFPEPPPEKALRLRPKRFAPTIAGPERYWSYAGSGAPTPFQRIALMRGKSLRDSAPDLRDGVAEKWGFKCL